MLILADLRNLGDNRAHMIEWHVGDVIKKLREKAGIKKGKFAFLAKMRPATLGAIEKTGRHDPASLEKIASTLRVSVAEIHAQVPGTNILKPAPPLVCSDSAHLELLQITDQAMHDGIPEEAIHSGIQALLFAGRLPPGSAAVGSERKEPPGDLVPPQINIRRSK